MKERLTKKVSGCFCYDLKDHKNVPGEFASYDAFFDYNMAVKRLGEYEDLEEEGRLVVLPCKAGDMVYYLRGLDILGDTVEHIILDGIDNQVLVGAHKAFMFCDFGRNVFRTREEAEAKLKEVDSDG